MTVLAAVDDDLVRRLRTAVASELSARRNETQRAGDARLGVDDQQMLAHELINRQLEHHAQECLALLQPVLSPVEEAALAQVVFDRIFHLGDLQPLIEDEAIMNVVANGYDRVFVEYADGTKAPGPPIGRSDQELIDLLRDVGRRYGLSEREFNPARPQLNLQLPDGSRLFAVAWVCSRPCLAVRRHRFMKVTLADLADLGAIDRGLWAFLAAAVKARQRIMIAGGTNVGKTTLLRGLAAEIPPGERIVTIETELELGLDRYLDLHPDSVALEAKESNVEGVGEVDAAELVRMSLRMRPDRVIVGEVRGAEVIPMLNAMSQGNNGSMCTVHADSSATVFNKLALYAIQAPERLPIEATNLLAADALDLVVFVAPTRSGRAVASVRQVVAAEGPVVVTNELFRPGPDGRAVPASPIPAGLLDQLVEAGYDPEFHHQKTGWWR